METWLAAGLAIGLVVLALYHNSIFITITYRRKSHDDLLQIEVSAFRRLVRYSLAVPVIELFLPKAGPWPDTTLSTETEKLDSNVKRERKFLQKAADFYFYEPSRWKKLKSLIDYYSAAYRYWAKRALADACCEKFVWRSRVGTDDAALTGMAAGLLWTIKQLALLRVRNRLRMSVRPELSVMPDYRGSGLQVEFECILRLRVGNVINATLAMIRFGSGRGKTGSG